MVNVCVYITYCFDIVNFVHSGELYTLDADGRAKEGSGVVGMGDRVRHQREASACDDMRSVCQNRTSREREGRITSCRRRVL